MRQRRFGQDVGPNNLGHNPDCRVGSLVSFWAKMHTEDVIACLREVGVDVVILETFGFKGTLETFLPKLEAEKAAFDERFPETARHGDFPRGWIGTVDIGRSMRETEPFIHLFGICTYGQDGACEGAYLEQDGLPVPLDAVNGHLGGIQWTRYPTFGFPASFAYGGFELFVGSGVFHKIKGYNLTHHGNMAVRGSGFDRTRLPKWMCGGNSPLRLALKCAREQASPGYPISLGGPRLEPGGDG